MRSLWFPLTVALIVALWAHTRFWPDQGSGANQLPAMPTKVTDAEERELYLTPGGLYTAADIAANGNMTATEKFAGFRANHDANPRPGEILCPVTSTKADTRCSWIIGGQTYYFCCPPCIDEFLHLAKTEPERVRSPGEYIQPER